MVFLRGVKSTYKHRKRWLAHLTFMCVEVGMYARYPVGELKV